MLVADRAFFALLITVILVSWTISWGVYKTPYFQYCLGEYEDRYHATEQPKEKPPTSPVPIGVNTRHDIACTFEFIEKYHESVVAVATIVLVLVTAILALYTAGLWKATTDLGRDAKNTSERQEEEVKQTLAIAKEAATAATDSVAVSRDTAARDLRAYVGVAKIEVRTLLGGLRTFLTINNGGRTPAYNVSSGMRWGWLPEGKSLDPSFSFPPGKPDDSEGSIAVLNGGGNSQELNFPFDADLSARTIVEKIKVLVYGEIIYFDVFKNEWRTNFNYWYHAWINQANGETVYVFNMAKEHNDAT